jgi:tetratricopeptide (TPR) repeat protein
LETEKFSDKLSDEEKKNLKTINSLKKAKINFDEGSDQAALLYLDDALELDPENSKIWDIRGVVLSRLDLKDEAQESFEVALDLKPDNAKAWSNLGILYASKGRFDEAINSFDHSIELENENDEIWNNRGTALFSLGKYKKALESFQRAIEINPDNAQAWAGKGSAHRFNGEYADAIESLEKFIKLASPALSPQVEEAWALIFELKMKIGEDNQQDK